MRQRFSDRVGFLTAYNPELLPRFAAHPDKCRFGNAPTFYETAQEFGEETPQFWWVAQLSAINKTSGARSKLDADGLAGLAETLSFLFGGYKVTEALLFLWNFKTQKYGSFYGVVDPDVILQAARRFFDETATARARHENDLHFAELEEMRERSAKPQEVAEMLENGKLPFLASVLQRKSAGGTR